jgi:hypothetical protein
VDRGRQATYALRSSAIDHVKPAQSQSTFAAARALHWRSFNSGGRRIGSLPPWAAVKAPGAALRPIVAGLLSPGSCRKLVCGVPVILRQVAAAEFLLSVGALSGTGSPWSAAGKRASRKCTTLAFGFTMRSIRAARASKACFFSA